MFCLIFIEDKQDFHRYDIIERIVNIINLNERNHFLLFIIIKSELAELNIVKQGVQLKFATDMDTAKYIIKKLGISHEIVELQETLNNTNFTNSFKKICNHIYSDKCFVLGLHNDYDESSLSKLGLKSIDKIKLSNVSYITSHCVTILLFLKKLCQHKELIFL